MVFVVSGIRISAPGIRIISGAPQVSESSAVPRVSAPLIQSEKPEPRTGLNPGRSPRRNES